MLLVSIGGAVIADPGRVTDALTADVIRTIPPDIRHGWEVAALNPVYWLLVGVMLFCERRWSAEPGTTAWSKGGAQDVLWIIFFPVFSLTFVAMWSGVLAITYDEILGGHVIDLEDSVGRLWAVVIAFVIADFFAWFTHYLRHVVPTFWYFHAVHHAPPQLNVLTDWRVHFMEAVIANTIVVVPALALGVDAVAATQLAIFTTYFTAFTHAAVRWNLGPLRWILVTPQSHRVHHGFAPEHIDKNFGTVFSVWDRIFRTQYLVEDEYPPTGIHDEDFPLETEVNGLGGHLLVYFQQVVYPFRQVLADFGATRRATT